MPRIHHFVHSTSFALLGWLTLPVLLIGCSHDGRTMKPPRADQNESVVTTSTLAENVDGFDTVAPPLDSAAQSGGDEDFSEFTLNAPWIDDAQIPAEYTCQGANISPPLAWSGIPAQTVTLAVVLIDTTDPTSSALGFVHWAVANIDSSVGHMDSNSVLFGTLVATNDFSTTENPSVGYRGPCPPAGQTHTYILELHALDQILELPTEVPGVDLVKAIDFATIQTASITATVTG